MTLDALQTAALTALGWSDFFERQLTPDDRTALRFGRVLEVQRDLVQLATPEGDWWATPSGKFRDGCPLPGDWPAAGDWCGFVPLEAPSGSGRGEAAGRALLQKRLDRRTAFTRLDPNGATPQVLAANLDALWLVASFNGELSLRRLERYLVAAAESGARPRILLNKADLVDDETRAALLRAVEATAPALPVAAVSAATGEGIAALRADLKPGETALLIGSSGVGKSSLTNALAGIELREVRAIRGRDDRGRHTTVARTLLRLPGGALLIDAPGLRTVRLWEEAGIDDAFAEIAALAAGCRFRDCRHLEEPGCAVNLAAAGGALDPDRLVARRRLLREAEFQARKLDRGMDAELRRLWRVRSRQQRKKTSLKRQWRG